MKLLSTSNLAGLGVLVLTLSSAPGAMPAQDATQSTKTAQAESSNKASADAAGCQDLKINAEQLAAQARIIQQDLQGKLGNLKDLEKWESGMSSPQIAKLQALADQLAKKGELQSNAATLAAKAQELAFLAQQDQTQDKQLGPLFGRQDFVINSDDSGG